jgi:hypothetical protein
MKRKHLGSGFEDFLAEDGVLKECRASAIKFKIAREAENVTDDRNVDKTKVAKRPKAIFRKKSAR